MVWLEDLGVLVGLTLALAGVALALVTGDPRFDAMGSVAIGVLLGVIAVVLAIEMKSLLIGESASPETRRELQAIIEDVSSVRRLIQMRTEHLGPEELLVGIKVELAPDLSFEGVVQTINALEKRIREHCPIARVVYVEPDIYRQ